MDEDFRIEGPTVSCPMLIIQVKNLPGSGIDVKGKLPLADLDIEDDGRFVIGDSMLHFEFHVAAARQDVIVTGSIRADLTAICDRCAEEAPLSIADNDVFHRYKNETDQPIDLTEDIREDILLALPPGFLCNEDCLGLCPKCGHNLNEGPCSCTDDDDDNDSDSFDDDKPDPWAAFDNLKLDK